MSTSATILFPHQLFKVNPIVDKSQPIYLVEETLYFNQYAFHKQKLVLHRASMQFYNQHLMDMGMDVHYIECHQPHSNCALLIDHLAKSGVHEIQIVDVIDNWLMKKIQKACVHSKIKLQVVDPPNFFKHC